MKRIVAVPADLVRYDSCSIFVSTASGQEVKDIEPTMACSGRGAFKQILLTNGMFFVAGDNRGNSFDSRTFGPVSKSQISAKVLAQVRLTWNP